MDGGRLATGDSQEMTPGVINSMKNRMPPWLILFGLVLGGFVLIPLLAPLFMAIGWSSAGKAIYLVYSFLCHQLPERSLFLFGPKLTYSLAEIQSAWQNTIDPLVLRQFVGNPAMGWKVAWSDRMVSMYTATWIFGLLWWPLHRRLKPLPWWGLALFLLPMAIDGFSHWLSDLAGIGEGFRFNNAWLAVLTNYSFPGSFYAGDTLGSFNSLLRWVTGFLFGAGVIWFSFPYLNRSYALAAKTRSSYSLHQQQGLTKEAAPRITTTEAYRRFEEAYIKGYAMKTQITSPIRVLLADDHAIVRTGIRQYLAHAGDIQVVAEASDGDMAKSLIQEHHPDVAVLDIQMPKSSGIEVTRWVRANRLEVGVLVLTAYNDDPYVLAVLQAGANGYMLKTASPEELIQAVRDVHEGRSALDAAVAQKLMAHVVAASQAPEVEPLTDRELEVLSLVAKGFTNKAIGLQLGISDRTVQGHLAHIFAKLHAGSRTEAVMRAVSLGWISHSTGSIPEE